MCCITHTLSMALSIRLNDWQLLNVQQGSLTIYRNEGGMGNKRESTTFDSHRKSMESWLVGKKNFVFCSDNNVDTIFRYWHKKSLARYSPNTLPTMVYGQAFHIITKSISFERGLSSFWVRVLGTQSSLWK